MSILKSIATAGSTQHTVGRTFSVDGPRSNGYARVSCWDIRVLREKKGECVHPLVQLQLIVMHDCDGSIYSSV